MRRGALGGALTIVALALFAPAAHARDVIVESFDDTPIVAHFYPAAGLEEGKRAPTILIGHGWGGTGESGGRLARSVHRRRLQRAHVGRPRASAGRAAP